MAVGDRSAKPTTPFEQQALERLAATGATRAPTTPYEPQELERLAATSALSEPAPTAVGSDRPHRELKGVAFRPTCKLHKDELLGLIHDSTLPTAEEILELDQEDRRTKQMSAKHFQLLARAQNANLPFSAEDIVRMGEQEVEALLLLDMRAAAPITEVAAPAPVEPAGPPAVETVREVAPIANPARIATDPDRSHRQEVRRAEAAPLERPSTGLVAPAHARSAPGSGALAVLLDPIRRQAAMRSGFALAVTVLLALVALVMCAVFALS